MLKGGGFEVVMQSQEQLNCPGFDHSVQNTHKSELSQWVEHVTKHLMIEDSPENENQLTPEGRAASPGESRPRKAPRRTVNDNPGSILPCLHPFSHGREDTDHNGPPPPPTGNDELRGMNLLTLLLECAAAISVDNLGEAHRILLELALTASPHAASPAERVAAYFAKAMSSRVINSWLGVCAPLVVINLRRSTLHAFQTFNNISPFIKFAHFTSNQAILEAFHRRSRVHIVDLDIMQGLQWPALFHILATRSEGPPQIRLTGFGSSAEILAETGTHLSNFARRLGMRFEFHPIAAKCGDLPDLSPIQIRNDETLAVHWLQHSLYDATGPDWKTLRLLQGLRPRVVTLIEQEIAHGGSFLDRFASSLHYYSTLFDSLGAFLPGDDSGRFETEHGLLYREINNVLAIGGPARSGEDKFRHWRSELVRSGFLQIPMSANSMAQAQLILNMFPVANGYSLVGGDGTLRLGWKETGLYTASAWTSSTSVNACFN